ncbi:MAG: sigma-70 family RNA polymerase sigma factor [Clostridia bacterium]|nr:sigma-70 family RNA polymerase sigma factor [Clostridia bacterium]
MEAQSVETYSMNDRRSLDTAGIVAEYYPLVTRICRSWLARYGAAEVEDAVQDVFLQYLRKPPRALTAEEEQAWFIRCAKNRAADYYRRLKRERSRHAELPGDMASEDEYFSDTLDSLLSTLPPETQMLFRLHYGEGYTWAEIASILRTNEAVLKMRVNRAKKKLREHLTEGEQNAYQS